MQKRSVSQPPPFREPQLLGSQRGACILTICQYPSIQDRDDVCLCGFILTEVLQGSRSTKSARVVGNQRLPEWRNGSRTAVGLPKS